MIYQSTQLFINGNWQDGFEGKSLSFLNSATGKEIGRVAAAGKLDIELAAAVAKDQFRKLA